jgi:hypothetical protein
MSKKVTLEEMFKQLQEWRSEATNFRNDGWTQEGYREKFDLLHTRIVTIMNDINKVAAEEEEKEAFRPNPREES